MLSDLIKPRLVELGKCKIGGLGEARAKQSGNGTYRLPRKDDHFTLTTLNRDANNDLVVDAELTTSLADFNDPDGKLRQLPIMVLSNDPEDIMQAAYVQYAGKRLTAKSDGRTLTKYIYPAVKGTGPVKTVTEPWKPEYADLKDDAGNPVYRLHVTLNFVVAAPVARWGGVYKFRSTSQISATNLYSSLLQLRMLTGGQLRGLPLRMVVRPVQVNPAGQTTTVYVVHIELRGADIQAIQQLAIERAKYEIENARELNELQTQYRLMLAAPGDNESDDEQSNVAMEYHADANGEVPNVPNNSSESFRDNFLAGIGLATCEDEILALGKEIKAALDSGSITKEDNTAINPVWKKRREELRNVKKEVKVEGETVVLTGGTFHDSNGQPAATEVSSQSSG